MWVKPPVDPESLVLHRVCHVQQTWSWDCGVTCVLMLLDEKLRCQAQFDLDRICAEEGFGQSTWTIDLCYLLKRFGVAHRMFTAHAGVSTAHRDLDYYAHNIDKDRARVAARFAMAGELGLAVKCARLSASALAVHLSTVGPALLLVSVSLLACERCRRRLLQAELGRWFGAPYTGHYILLVGYDPKRNRFFYLDPARPPCPGPGWQRASHQKTAHAKEKKHLNMPNNTKEARNQARLNIKLAQTVKHQDPNWPINEANVFAPCVVGARRLLAAAAARGTDRDVILIDRSYR